MNKQDKSIEIFSRIANYVVSKHLNRTKGSASYEYVQELINSANLINQTLVTTAIRMIKKVQQKGGDAEMLTDRFRHIIHNSVIKYTQSYS